MRFKRSIKVFSGSYLKFSGVGISSTIGLKVASIIFCKKGTTVNTGISGKGKMKKYLFFAFFIFYTDFLLAQKHGQEKIDSIFAILKMTRDDSVKINLFNDISYNYRNINADSGLTYGKFGYSAQTACMAQLMTNDNVTITIIPSTQLTVQGDIQNQNASSINNNGTIDFSGNWVHNAANNCFNTSSGTVILNGGTQSIGGTNSTLFNNFTLLSSGTKTLLQNATVGGSIGSGVLNVGSRNLDLNSKSVTITNPLPTAIAYTTGNIRSEQTNNASKVVWNMGASTGAHIIPFGSIAGLQIPFTLNLTSGTIGNVTVSTYPTIANNTPYPIAPMAVTNVKNISGADNSANMVDRFWQVDKSGASGTATLTFSYLVTEQAANGNTNMRGQLWKSPVIGWETPLPLQSSAVNSVTVPLVTNFGAWALVIQSSPLPVELISFNAVAIHNNEVLCSWATATETNNDFFTVLRSQDDTHFEQVSKVNGHGTTTIQNNYSALDKDPFKGISYYQLKQTDFNGDETFSQIVAVKIAQGTDFDFSIYPNPATNDLIIFHSENTEATNHIIISDMNGKLVFDKTVYEPSGKISLNVSGLANGVYMCTVAEGENAETKKLVIAK